MAKSNPHQPWNTSCKENLRSPICSRDWRRRRRSKETVGSGTRRTRSRTRLLPIGSLKLLKGSSLMGPFILHLILRRFPLTPTQIQTRTIALSELSRQERKKETEKLQSSSEQKGRCHLGPPINCHKLNRQEGIKRQQAQ